MTSTRRLSEGAPWHNYHWRPHRWRTSRQELAPSVWVSDCLPACRSVRQFDRTADGLLEAVVLRPVFQQGVLVLGVRRSCVCLVVGLLQGFRLSAWAGRSDGGRACLLH